jgi:hypothetical protein
MIRWAVSLASLRSPDAARRVRGHGSSLPFGASSAISPTFIARLIKGCRVDVRAGYLEF